MVWYSYGAKWGGQLYTMWIYKLLFNLVWQTFCDYFVRLKKGSNIVSVINTKYSAYLSFQCVNLCFVKRFKVLDGNRLTVEETDKQLQCIRFWWQWKTAKTGRLTAGGEFGPISIESIWSVAHVVQSNKFILQTINCSQKKEMRNFLWNQIWMERRRVLPFLVL